jgi:hypothetical protein
MALGLKSKRNLNLPPLILINQAPHEANQSIIRPGELTAPLQLQTTLKTFRSLLVLWNAREPLLREKLVHGVVMKIAVLIVSVYDVIGLSKDAELKYQSEYVHGVDIEI